MFPALQGFGEMNIQLIKRRLISREFMLVVCHGKSGGVGGAIRFVTGFLVRDCFATRASYPPECPSCKCHCNYDYKYNTIPTTATTTHQLQPQPQLQLQLH